MQYFADRRRCRRFHVPGATVFFAPYEAPHPVLTLGRGGLGFASDNRIEPGREISLILNIPTEHIKVELLARVAYCRAISGASSPYRIGVAFAPFDMDKGCNPQDLLELLVRLEKTYA